MEIHVVKREPERRVYYIDVAKRPARELRFLLDMRAYQERYGCGFRWLLESVSRESEEWIPLTQTMPDKS